MFERQQIASLHERGHGVGEISRRIGRFASTVSWELGRNTKAWDDGFDPLRVHLRSHERAKCPKRGKFEQSPWLTQCIQDKLNLLWSPEQIALHLRRHHGEHPDRQVCVESIYQGLYRSPDGGIPRALTRQLRPGRPLRRCQRRPDQRTLRFLAAMRSIHDRPITVGDRVEPRHWERDLIVCSGNRSAIDTLAIRTIRRTLWVHLPEDRMAGTVTPALIGTLSRVPPQMRRSVTWDQGAEVAEDVEMSQALGILIYISDPGSPWQRGTIENTNGLPRQCFPKGTDLSV